MRAWRRFTTLTIATLALGIGVSLGGCGSSSRSSSNFKTRCGSGAFRPTLQTQGTATQAVVFLTLTNRSGSACTASGKAVFEVEQNGRRARVRNNPLSFSVSIRLLAGQRKLVPRNVWWANWCGSSHNIGITVHFAGNTVHSPFSVLPACLSPNSPSRLILPFLHGGHR